MTSPSSYGCIMCGDLCPEGRTTFCSDRCQDRWNRASAEYDNLCRDPLTVPDEPEKAPGQTWLDFAAQLTRVQADRWRREK